MRLGLTISSIVLLLACQSTSRRLVTDEKPPTSPPTPADITLEVFDQEFSQRLFGDSLSAQTLITGMDWSEGPLVLPSGEVICSDVPRNHIRRWATVADTATIYLKNSGAAPDDYSKEPGSNGLYLDYNGDLLLCQHGARRIARMDAPLDSPEPRFVTIADRYSGKRFNSPNDLIVAPDSSILFTDPIYGLPNQHEGREIDYCGVFRVDPRGNVTLLTKEYSRPNGIGLSPDGRTLYLANSDGDRAVVTATPLSEDFRLGEPRILIDATELAGKEPGYPDGLVVAQQGHIFATAPGGVWVIKPDGTLLAKIRSRQSPVSNVALSPAENYLYLTNDDRLLRVQLNPL